MNLYTIGHRDTYRKNLAKGGLWKAEGGFAFRSPEAARAWVEKNGGYNGNPPEAYAVFEMEDAPTTWHHGAPILKVKSRIIREVEAV